MTGKKIPPPSTISKTCSANECARNWVARGLCDMHYRRLYRHDKPLPPKLRGSLRWFWGCVDRSSGDNGCWPWLRGRHTFGYGEFTLNEKSSAPAHRIAWELINGPIPDGLFVLHSCDNPPCVNPKHLFLGTQMDNMQDMIQKGRAKKRHGRLHPCTKLTEHDIPKIFSLRRKGFFYADIADIYDMSVYAISAILHRRTWKHVKI